MTILKAASETMTIEDALHEIVTARDGILLTRADNEFLVLDRLARRVFPVNESNLVDEARFDELLERACNFLDAEDPDSQEPEQVFELHIPLENISSPVCRSLAEGLIQSLSSAGKVRLYFYFRPSTGNWPGILGWIEKLRTTAESMTDDAITIIGAFPILSDDLKESLFRLRLRLGFVCGWWDGCPADQYQKPDWKAIRDLADFGLRIPLVWYVHSENINGLHSILDAAFEANQHSGFSLPLVCSSPYYRFASDYPALPSLADYSEFLAMSYQSHWHHDDVLAPLSELAELMGRGGWCLSHGVPSRIRLLLGAQSVGVFRQVPVMARRWKLFEELAEISQRDVVSNLLSFHRLSFAWEKNYYCQACPWRHVCGGLDAASLESCPNDGRFDIVCGHRKLFLEMFAWQASYSWQNLREGANRTLSQEENHASQETSLYGN